VPGRVTPTVPLGGAWAQLPFCDFITFLILMKNESKRFLAPVVLRKLD